MSYNNYNKGSYGNSSSYRGGYKNSNGSYNGGQNRKNEQQQDKSFGARFRIRGIACTNKDTGEGFTRINTKSGTPMCSVNVMVKKYRNTGDVDRDGRTVWNENIEYIRLVAFGKNAEVVMSTVKAKSIIDFSGDILVKKMENGPYDTTFAIDKVEVIKEFSGASNSSYQNRKPNGYQRTNGQQNSVNYDERPNNYSQREQKNSYQDRDVRDNVNQQEDYAETSGNNDIPF